MTTPPRAPSVVRLGVWLLLAVLVTLGVALASLEPAHTAAVPAAQVHAGEVLASHGDGLFRPAGSGGPALERYNWSEDGDETIKLLPGWRWSGDTSLFANLPFEMGRGIFPNMATGLGSMAFGLSSWLWGMLLGVLKFALTTNIARMGGSWINRGFEGMFNSINTAGVLVLMMLMGLFTAMKLVMKVQIGAAFRAILTVLIPIGLMYGLAFTTAGTNTRTDPLAKGTPAWVADRGVSFVDEVGYAMGSGFGLTESLNVSFEVPVSEYFPGQHSCGEYIQTLHHQFDQKARDTSDITGIPSSALRDMGRAGEAMADDARKYSSSRKLVGTVSTLWSRAFLDPWISAQYGQNELGARIACHQLEGQNRIPASEQAAIASLAGYATTGDGVYRSHPGKNDRQQAALLAWVACTHSGQPSALVAGFDGLDTDGCGTWASTGEPPKGLQSTKKSNLADATINNASITDESSRMRADAFYQLYDSLTGGNSTQRMIGGVMSLAIAVVYLWVLGGIAVGSIIGQFGLVIMLMLLPVTLTLLAMPNRNGGRSQLGIRMLRITGGFFGAKLALVLMMTLLMQAIMVMTSIVGSSGRGMANILHMIIPLAALFLLRYLLKKVGFGNITSTTGAMALATGAAMATDGRGEMFRRQRTRMAEQLGDRGLKDGKYSLNSFDAFSKRKGRGALAAATRNASRYGLGAASAADNQFLNGKAADKLQRGREGMELRKNSLLGTRDENGQLVEDGFMQRASSFAGLVTLGQDAHKRFLPDHHAKVRQRLAKAERDGTLERLASLDPAATSRAKISQQQAALRRQHRQMIARGGEKQAVGKDGKPLVDKDGNPVMAPLSRRELGFETGSTMLHGVGVAGQQQYAKLLGEDFRDGDFEQRASFLSAYKDSVGYSRKAVVIPDNGMAALVTPSGRAGFIPAGETDESTVDQARMAQHYLDPALAARRRGEDDTEYATRLHMYKIMGGAVDIETGAELDWAAVNGVDLSSEWGRAEALKSARGEDSALHNLKISLKAADIAFVDSFMSEAQMRSVNLDPAADKARLEEIAKPVVQAREVVVEARSQAQSGVFELQEMLRDLNQKSRSAPADGDAAAHEREIAELQQRVAETLDTQVKQSLVEGRSHANSIKSYAVLNDPDVESAEKNATVKRLKIETIEFERQQQQHIDNLKTTLMGAEGIDLVEAGSQIMRYARSQIDSADAALAESNTAWSKSFFTAQERMNDRRVIAQKAAEANAKVPSRRLAENLGNFPRGASAPAVPSRPV
jgi:hypothetical protein